IKKMKPVRVYFVCSFLRGLYCLKVCSFQLMENRRVSILKLMGMGYKHHHIDNEMDIWHYLRLNQKYREQDPSNSGNQNSNEIEVPAENII
ncbi:hypothetical protein P4K16_31035, partial [Bacillus cereus]|nr:hypothetical protein [Bacillus cereus]